MRLQSTVLRNSRPSTSPQYGNGSDIIQNYGVRFVLCSDWVVSCEPTPTPICVLMMKFSFACSVLLGNLTGLPGRRPWYFGILLILASELSSHPHPCLYFNVQITAVKLWQSAHTSFSAITTPPTHVCMLMSKYIGACAWGPSNLSCSPGRRQMFTVVNHSP
ncbi:hypothetical protein Cgig2_024390 [Carnegiea gigantea]|uniref:Uncharacterized protein n=1 Tax=Carnegiea gigantea TaxID=171969 RepID=A0A9Q1GWN5_9CARY|nr:hypothetical protein Cgig2_024390 [Carnegiea gigantea]